MNRRTTDTASSLILPGLLMLSTGDFKNGGHGLSTVLNVMSSRKKNENIWSQPWNCTVFPDNGGARPVFILTGFYDNAIFLNNMQLILCSIPGANERIQVSKFDAGKKRDLFGLM